MNVNLDQFCEILAGTQLSNAEKAVAVLWYFDKQEPNIIKSARELARVLTDHHAGTPNQTTLAQGIRKTKLINESKAGFSLKPGSRRIVPKHLPTLDGLQPLIDHSIGYLPEPIWVNTKGYIQEICREINGCFSNGYFNAAAVLIRRLLETLIIESYEKLGRIEEIKSGGNYFMLSELADRACGEKGHTGINLGRDSKTALKDAKNIGNWSAHARRFLARSSDLVKFKVEIRVLTQELILISDIQPQDVRKQNSQND